MILLYLYQQTVKGFVLGCTDTDMNTILSMIRAHVHDTTFFKSLSGLIWISIIGYDMGTSIRYVIDYGFVD